ncbi:L,D-transpeptidase family protein [Aquabacter spiritensis]|uniref:L,D-transpeptidase-like protein n=1 Tax=Aquabacter spiritensis TaxID=933073 RepID=A0A4V2UXW6_9HYPH|nr:L,D-transpeptidase [Aquabacter spiritensis]TCT05108.1 L,D-transpeptidase-like protein [Aquabacter spiritensis]
MMLRTKLLTALGASLLALPAHAQLYQGSAAQGQVYQGQVYQSAVNERDVTGAIGQAPTAILPSGSVPGYNDPYARTAPNGDYVQRTPIAPPPGAVQAPSYGTSPAPQTGYATLPAPGQPVAIGPQGGYPAQQPQAVPQAAYPQGGYASDGGYEGSYKQDALLQAARNGTLPAPAAVQPGATPVYADPRVAYGTVPTRDAGPAPSGVYAPNAAVVPGTTEAPSGPRIENIDPSEPVDSRFLRQTVDYVTTQPAGTIIIDTPNTYLYYVLGGGKAIRYGIGVGRDGFTWSGTEKITRKAEWADWRPPPEMIDRQPYLPRFMAGGPGNPLGARTLYLGGTIYRIHGTNEPQTIGKFVSSGCFRMLNADVEDLFERAKVGTKVVILPKSNAQANAAAGKPQGTAQR